MRHQQQQHQQQQGEGATAAATATVGGCGDGGVAAALTVAICTAAAATGLEPWCGGGMGPGARVSGAGPCWAAMTCCCAPTPVRGAWVAAGPAVASCRQLPFAAGLLSKLHTFADSAC